MQPQNRATPYRDAFQALLIATAAFALWLLSRSTIFEPFSTFVTTFLGIFIEAVPFLLLGTFASGLVEVFISAESIQSLLPRGKLSSILIGSVLGFFFPVCECGVIPLARRLMQKGLPRASAITFLLASPVLNPIVLFSTYAAFGWSKFFYGRALLSFLVATLTGAVFAWLLPSTQPATESPLQFHLHPPSTTTTAHTSWQRVAQITADEFFEMGRYLIIGALLAALMQSLIPQSLLLQSGTPPIFASLTLAVLAVLLSICSTVDAFVALAFINTFPAAAVLTFLVYGPMVDVKSLLLYRQVFDRRSLLALSLIPLLLTLLLTPLFG
ncbi:MAG: permease [Anaerolineales bacterium]